jgi:hypothetical protein
MKHVIRTLVIVLAILTWTDLGFAQRRGGGGRSFGGGGRGFSARASARPSVNYRPATRPSFDRGNINRGNINRGDINRGDYRRDINIDRDVNIDADRHWGADGCCYHHPVARAAAVATGAAITAAAIGSVVYSLPASCSSVYVNGVTYEQCSDGWYQPQFTGTSTTYVVVGAPQ